MTRRHRKGKKAKRSSRRRQPDRWAMTHPFAAAFGRPRTNGPSGPPRFAPMMTPFSGGRPSSSGQSGRPSDYMRPFGSTRTTSDDYGLVDVYERVKSKRSTSNGGGFSLGGFFNFARKPAGKKMTSSQADAEWDKLTGGETVGGNADAEWDRLTGGKTI